MIHDISIVTHDISVMHTEISSMILKYTIYKYTEVYPSKEESFDHYFILNLICKEKASATDTSIIDSECNRYIERVQQIHTNYTYLYLLKLYLIEKK